jgi:hypothetical protein
MRAPRDSVKSSATLLPLAHLRRGPGRPRHGDRSSDKRQASGHTSPVSSPTWQHGTQALIATARLLDRAAAAAYLGISVDTLDRLTRQGHVHRLLLPGTRCVRFDVRELDVYVAAL